MTDDFTVPDLPSESRVELVTSTLLTVAKLMSGAGIGIGSMLTAMPQDKISSMVTLAIFAVSFASAAASWVGSRWQHHKMAVAARNATVSAAVASAQISAQTGTPTPVTVTVTPPGQLNVAVPVTAQEQSTADTANVVQKAAEPSGSPP